MKIGIISDTHDVLPPAVAQIFAGVDHILHAGDITEEHVLEQLARIAPVTAVRGNMDRRPWAGRLPIAEALDIDGLTVYMVHRPEDLDVDPESFDLVVHGHTHRPRLERMGKATIVNPGSAGDARHGFGPSVAVAQWDGETLTIRHIELPG